MAELWDIHGRDILLKIIMINILSNKSFCQLSRCLQAERLLFVELDFKHLDDILQPYFDIGMANIQDI